MRGLVIAGAAALAGVAGVVGMSTAMDGGAEPSAATTVPAAVGTTTTSPGALDDRLARLARAERAADAALARTAPSPPAAPAPSSVAPLERRGDGSIDDTQGGVHVPALDDDRSGDDDDRWDDDDHEIGDDDHGRWDDDDHDDD